MSKKALLALCVAVLIPLAFYLIASRYGVAMPPRYFADSVITTMKDGKQMTDTVWHRVENIPLVNQLGEPVSLEQDSGKVIVIDFFFTHCASICPILTRNIKRMQDGLKQRNDAGRIDASIVRFMSISVDPLHDSPSVLKRYADRYGVNSDVWWLLTGQKKTIYDFALNELKLGLQDSVSVDSNFVHTDYVTLLDKQHVVRGYYHGTDTTAMNKLADDIVFIMLEKDKHRKSVFTELRPLMIPILVILIGTLIGVIYFSRRSPDKKLPS
ncbi:MAG: SCO family protein [Bacteroidota bacterium]|nr:SCO family protein [Bacteroidota bacterium]MDP4217208.1 SCO family protein [Bacteroidota bacterium]MDP4244818.1 SCO family protein [Bacteroidota bacterium]MDP4252575.1 SCO family protein [Bacteroidota bacterium]MDP4258423.1 SCO family protein [Bacteroidota bacterium]